jgi:hypothetical protein
VPLTCFEIAELHVLNDLSESAFDIEGCAILLLLFVLLLLLLIFVFILLLILLIFFLVIIILRVGCCGDRG